MGTMVGFFIFWGGFALFFGLVFELIHINVYGKPYTDQFRKDHMNILARDDIRLHDDILSYWDGDIQMATISNCLISKWAIFTRDGSSVRSGIVWRWSKLHYLLERQYYKHQNAKMEHNGMTTEYEVVPE